MNERPEGLSVKRDNIPEAMREHAHWIVWRYEWSEDKGKWDKPPRQAANGRFASSTDASTWTSFEAAWDTYKRGNWDGLGFVLGESCPFFAVDLDHCIQNNKIVDRAGEIIRKINTYTELSPSGTGIHIIGQGNLPEGRRRRDTHDPIEMYDEARYITVTGRHVAKTPKEIRERQTEINALHAEEFEEPESETVTPPTGRLAMDDVELLQVALNEKGGKFERLFNGNMEGYPSQSEADQALCNKLAFYTRGDPERMDRLFRQSGLYREKWDRNGYRQKTIQRAIKGTGEFYTPASKHTSGNTSKNESEDEEEGDGKSPSMKDMVLQLALDRDIELFTDQQNVPFCRVLRDGHYENLPIGTGRSSGEHFSDWLGWLLYTEDGRLCSSQTVDPARRVLRAKARFEGEQYALKNRVARSRGAVWYDMSDPKWRAIRITTEGWEIEPKPPIIFKRYAHQKPQVRPRRVDNAPETLNKVFQFANLQDEKDRLIFTVYLVSLLVPDIAHPIPVIHGEQGSGKTFMLKSIRQLVDPSAVGVLSIPWESDEFVQQLAHHWCAYYDNLTSLTQWQQDVLCRAVTGEGTTKRKLWSDDQDVIYSYRRCIALNGINITSARPDLLDRSVLFELAPLEDERQTEAELRTAFEKQRGQLFGALLNVISGALRESEETATELGRFFRLADWAAWGWRIGEALGNRGDEFIDAYAQATESKAETALDLHPLGQAVVAFMRAQDEWEGSPKTLKQQLERVAEEEGIDTEANGWPGSASWLGRRLKEVRPDLRTAGITYDSRHDGGQRLYKFTKSTNGI